MISSKFFMFFFVLSFFTWPKCEAEDERKAAIGLYVEEQNFPTSVVEDLRQRLIFEGNKLISEGIKTKKAMKISITEITELTNDSFQEFGILLLYTECKTLMTRMPDLNKREAYHPDFSAILVTSDTCTKVQSPSIVHYLVQAHGDQRNYIQILLDWQLHDWLEWKSMHLVYDESADAIVMNHVLKLGDFISTLDRKSPTMVFKYSHSDEDGANNAGQIIAHVTADPIDHNNFALFGKLDTVAAVLSAASKRTLLTTATDWMVFLIDEEDTDTETILQAIGNSLAGNITNLGLATISGNMTDASEFHAKKLHKCLLDHYVSTLEEIVRRINAVRVPLPLAGQLQKLMRGVSCSSDYLVKCCGYVYLNYFTHHEGPKIVKECADWEMGKGFTSLDKLFIYKTQNAFNGYELSMFTILDPPWQILPPNVKHAKFAFKLQGISFLLLKELLRRLRFRYMITLYTPTVNETMDSESIWENSVRAMEPEDPYEQYAHLVAIATDITEKKSERALFTFPFHHEPHVILSARPKQQTQVYLFLQPFGLQVWLLLFAIMVVVSASLYFIHNCKVENEEQEKAKIIDCCLLTYGVLLQQGMHLFAKRTSGRVLLGAWLMCAIIIGAMYCGNLVAFLTIPRLTPHVRNIDELLLAEGTVTWGIANHSTMMPYLMTTKDERMIRVRDGAIIHPEITSDVMQEVREGRHVILEAKTKLLFRLEEEFNRTKRYDYVVGENVYYDRIAFAVAKTYPHFWKFNAEMERIVSTGIVRKWKNDFWPKLDETFVRLTVDDSDTIVISIYDFQSSIYALFLGCSLGILVFILEMIFGKCPGSKRKKSRT